MQRYNNICHSDDRKKEESRIPPLYVPEILRFALDDKEKPSIIKKCKSGLSNFKNMLKNIVFHPFYLQIRSKAVPLHCVFHSIRFKVNKVGARRCSFFYARTFQNVCKIQKKPRFLHLISIYK